MAKKAKTKTKQTSDGKPPFPTRDQVVAFINESPHPVGKREIARAFNLRGADKIPLKALLKEMKEEGLIGGGKGKRARAAGTLPGVTVIEIVAVTLDGEVLARPVRWEEEAAPPKIYVAHERVGAPGIGDRLLARLKRSEDGSYDARVMRRIETAPDRILGVFDAGAAGGAANAPGGGPSGGLGGGLVMATDRRLRHDIVISPSDTGGALPGELVLVEGLPGRPLGARRGRVVERYGDGRSARAASLIAVHTHDIPLDFPADALAEAGAAQPVDLGDRADLRDLPLVTIDGADARDFDDAVWAEPDADPENSGGWHLVVAIADVAHYVRPGSALDRAAYERGNSVYFPDRVVPMLPEALSNDLCSLRPEEPRACVAAHLWIDPRGRLRRHRFERALMRSAARMTYEQVQAARDGHADETAGPLATGVIRPLYGAYEALGRGRRDRHTLELDLPERKIELADDGRVARIARVTRLDSHRLIEEFMITANVAAAETLEARDRPCMYRVHEPPEPKGIEALSQVLRELGLSLPKGAGLKPQHFNRLLAETAGTPNARMVNELVLRAQSRADYGPNNLGHFGLALRRYAHFTSPIRRYADLLVHRALVGGGTGPGADGLPADARARFTEWGEHISVTERRAMAAERDASDRYVAAFLADRVGATFSGTINGVARAGLFVTLDETGASGFLPARLLPDDRYTHDESRHALVGERTGLSWRIGETVTVTLREANAVTGSLILELADMPPIGERPNRGGRRMGGPKRGRGGPSRAKRSRRAR